MYNGLDHISSTAHLHCCSIESTNGQRFQYNSSDDLIPRRDHRSQHSINQRYGNTSRMASSLATFEDSMTEIVMDDVPNENEPTSEILNYCKRKFLRPYMTILALVGLNPISTDTTQCKACLSYLQAFIILLIICFGYFLQFLSSYRGDLGFTGQRRQISNLTSIHMMTVRNWGEVFFGYVIPNSLHLSGFVSAIFVCKVSDKEQLQNLIERVFLMTANPKRLCTILWVYIGLGLSFVALLFGYVVPGVVSQNQIIQVEWLPVEFDEFQTPVKVALLCTALTQDLVEIVILTSYAIECYLLSVHLHTLSQKLLMHSIQNIDWMKELLEFRKLLDHLNNKLAIPVCFFTIMNLSYAFAGIIFLFKNVDFHYTELKLVLLYIMNILLWLLMGLLPFFTAASVTRVCQTARASGHQIRVRPFVYHNTSADDLNSTLLFASSLNMSAKLFRMPIQSNYLCFAIFVISIVVLTLGMCLNFSLDIL